MQQSFMLPNAESVQLETHVVDAARLFNTQKVAVEAKRGDSAYFVTERSTSKRLPIPKSLVFGEPQRISRND